MATMLTKVRLEPIVELRERVESMMVEAMSNNFVCAICIENLSRRGVLATPCGHMFHDDCLKKWFPAHFRPDDGMLTPRTMKRRQETGPCPTCNGGLELDHCTKIFLQAEGVMNPLNTSMTTRFSDVEKMLDDTKKQLDDAKMEASKTRNELFRSKQQVEVLKMEAVEIKKHLERGSEQQVEVLKMEVEGAKKEAEGAKKEAERAKKEAEEVERNLERVNQVLAEAKKVGEEEKQKRMDAQISERVFKKQAADVKKELKELKKELKELKKEHSKCSKYEKQVDTCLGRIRKAIESVPRRQQDSAIQDADSDDEITVNP